MHSKVLHRKFLQFVYAKPSTWVTTTLFARMWTSHRQSYIGLLRRVDAFSNIRMRSLLLVQRNLHKLHDKTEIATSSSCSTEGLSSITMDGIEKALPLSFPRYCSKFAWCVLETLGVGLAFQTTVDVKYNITARAFTYITVYNLSTRLASHLRDFVLGESKADPTVTKGLAALS